MTSHVIAYRSLELLFGTHTLHFNCFFDDFNCIFTQIHCLSRVLVNGKIQGLFKAFECSSSTFQGKFYFQGLFKTELHIQVLFKAVKTLANPSACYETIHIKLSFVVWFNS